MKSTWWIFVAFVAGVMQGVGVGSFMSLHMLASAPMLIAGWMMMCISLLPTVALLLAVAVAVRAVWRWSV